MIKLVEKHVWACRVGHITTEDVDPSSNEVPVKTNCKVCDRHLYYDGKQVISTEKCPHCKKEIPEQYSLNLYCPFCKEKFIPLTKEELERIDREKPRKQLGITVDE